MSAALVSGWSRNWRGKPLCGSLSRRSGRSVPSDWAYWCHDAGVGRNRREGVGRACSANALRSPPRAAEARPGIDRRQSGARARWPNPEHLSGSSARRPRWSPRKGARSRLSCHRFRPRDRVSTFNNVSASVPRHPAPRPDPFGKRRSRRRREIGWCATCSASLRVVPISCSKCSSKRGNCCRSRWMETTNPANSQSRLVAWTSRATLLAQDRVLMMTPLHGVSRAPRRRWQAESIATADRRMSGRYAARFTPGRMA